jgi:dipeptidyl aminopeptidase/acylaminoacyl peptidase
MICVTSSTNHHLEDALAAGSVARERRGNRSRVLRKSTFYTSAASLLLSLCAMHALAEEAAPARRMLTTDDFYRVQDVSDPQTSPDGQWVAYVVTTNDRDADEARSAIWMVSWDGGQRLALTGAAGGNGKPRWSPDGRYLAFLAVLNGSDRTQIMLLDRRGGEARRLTSAGGAVGDYAWSPDGKRVVFTVEQGDAAIPPKPIVIDAIHFKQDEDGYLGTSRERHLYLIDVDDKHSEQLTSNPGYNEDLPAWSPDGRWVAFVRTRGLWLDQDGREDIDIVEPRSGATPHNLVRPFAPNTQKLAWSPNGAQIAYLQGLEPKFIAYMQDRLMIVPAAGGAAHSMTENLDRTVRSFAFAADSASITIAVEDDGTVYPARVDLASGSISRETPAGPSVVWALSSASGHTALLESSDAAPAEVYALEAGQLRKLTAHNDAFLAQLKLGAVQNLRFNSRDGTEIHALMVTPPGFVPGRRYPTVLWVHGGPNLQHQHSLALDAVDFQPQMFAAKGYVVLLVNYRGGAGRGIAFAKAIFADWGHKEVEDLLAGVDYLAARGIADPDRLAIGGWSYGGILTDYTIASDRRFKAAISGAGSADQLAIYGSDEYVLQYNNELGPPWKNTALWLKVSYPFLHADRIHTPTLFMGGDKDFNVPINGGEQMYQALRTLGVPTQLVVYPDQHHVLTRPSFVKDLAERMSAWLERYIGH